MKAVLTLVVFILLPPLAGADCQTVSSVERKCYDNSNSPPAVIYRQLVNTIFVDSVEYLEALDRLKDEEHHAGRALVDAGITPNMSSADVVRYFVEKFLEVEQEVHDTQKQMLCVDGKPRYNGAENFVIFNQLDELSVNIYEKHYLLTRADLQASGLFDLDKVLEEDPVSFTEIFLDHEKARDGSIKQVYDDAVRFCESSFSISVSSSISVFETENQPQIQ